ncbi:MAG: hypothetical protein QUS09_05320, partial [Methanotrichaceae archaeon]|nr:hypothetical protein [Methanotrichaceae archaeon]
MEEVNTLQKSHKAKTKADARRAAKIIKNYVSLGLVDIRGEEREPFADNVFHYVFSMLRTQYDLTLITQDTALAMEILALRHSKAIRSSKQLNVYRITQFGDIREWREGTEDGASGSPEHDRDMETKPLFRSCMRPRPNKDILIPVKTVPTVGDRVRVHGRGTTVLQKVLASGGGEGVIYSTSSGDACKIFHRERITEGRRRKLSLMASSPIEIDGVCWPIAPVLNGSDEFVGYLMPLAHGKPLQKCLFIKPLLVQNFPNWDRQQLVQLAITWLEKVIALHKNNVLIGDINPMNILVDSDARMYLVDTDSFQVEDFPCTVGMANFTAPEIQRRPFSSFLRTPEHEAFAVATMLFMILMPGKPPYSHQGGGDPISNIMSGNFSYPLGAESNRKTPDGPWRFIWSHFPYRTKEAFYNCFKEGKRLSPEEWASILRGYHYDLQSGHLDPSGESLKIFPTGFKQVSDYAHDKYGAEREKLVEFRCDICGNTFKVPAEKSAKFSAEKNKTCR